MGGGGAKPFYPALMEMPVLTPEARRFIEAEAARRLGAGSEAITTGQAPLHAALAANDPKAMRQAIADVREGVLLAESGAAALVAVNEARPPHHIALAWFKGQMNTASRSESAMNDGPWGFTWLHFTTMGFLLAVVLGAVLIHYARFRRIDGLVQRLSPSAAPAGGSPKPGVATDGAKPAPTAPGGAGTGQSAVAAAKPDPPKPGAPASAAGKPWSGALKVAEIFQETPAVKTFRLMSLDGGPIPFSFQPGQYLSFSGQIDGKAIRRSYTIASSPTQHDYVEITVKREEQGAESRYLHDHITTGDHLDVTGPSGKFTFTGAEADSIVLISGGVGITPMMCVLRYLTDRGFPGEIYFLHGTRSARDIIFCEELSYLRKRHANVQVVITVADYEDLTWAGPVGHLSKELITRSVPDIARRRIHVCGPPAMMEAVKASLAELGVLKEQIKSEAFGPAKGAAPPGAGAAGPDPEANPSAAAPPKARAADPVASAEAPGAAVEAAPAATPSAAAQVEFRKSGKSGALAPDQPVLEAAEEIGVTIEFECRVGTCGTCVVPLLEGEVTMAVEDGLNPEDKARGIILACQAKSAGNIVVDA